ncbi:MAG: T9SS type A sorting domain-containing protein [Candidatus Syntrophosphaera sp.]|nr:T9SS type A sorting domain-containing protein [Candidatus Syntrophosphaera sp.]
MKNSVLYSIFLLLGLLLAGGLRAQCMLANPSFEVSGQGGTVFTGWEQFGQTGASTESQHGSLAAKVSGQNTGSLNVSGFWQRLDCAPGEEWHVRGYVLNTIDSPLSEDSFALVNVEWRNAGGELIDYDSFTVADAASPAGVYASFDLLSSPAPAGTAAIHLLLGALQAQNDPPPEVLFDQITCYSTAFPTIDDMQWNDFPSGRSLEFSNRTWRVKGSGWYGPGPNNFSHLPSSVWVDSADRLHLTIKQIAGVWYSTEVTLFDTLGYGDYVFTTLGSLGQLNERAVLGLFLWQYGPCYDQDNVWWNPYNEIDVEFSRWGTPGNQIGQFVAQPWDWPGNMARFDAVLGAEQLASHAFNWLSDRVEFRSWLGGPQDESPANLIYAWNYTGPHIPRPEQPRVHLNLWYVGSPPNADQEAILTAFTFVPAGGGSPIQDQVAGPVPLELNQNFPNPFNPSTSISFDLSRPGRVRLEIFDLRGRKVATLADEFKQAGHHALEWDARNQASGIYFCRLSSGSESISRKMLLLK